MRFQIDLPPAPISPAMAELTGMIVWQDMAIQQMKAEIERLETELERSAGGINENTSAYGDLLQRLADAETICAHQDERINELVQELHRRNTRLNEQGETIARLHRGSNGDDKRASIAVVEHERGE
jgi:chromosome segregation ATPase